MNRESDRLGDKVNKFCQELIHKPFYAWSVSVQQVMDKATKKQLFDVVQLEKLKIKFLDLSHTNEESQISKVMALILFISLLLNNLNRHFSDNKASRGKWKNCWMPFLKCNLYRFSFLLWPWAFPFLSKYLPFGHIYQNNMLSFWFNPLQINTTLTWK